MKRLLVLLSVGALALGMAGCGSQDSGNVESPQPSVSSMPEIIIPTPNPTQSPDPTQSPEASGAETGTDAIETGSAGGHDYSLGWTEEMTAVKTAVTDLLGDNYFPNMAWDPEILEDKAGITPDMYEDYFAEGPMISTNVDTLIVVKAAEGQVDTVEEMLNNYRDGKVSQTMQYPQNVGKIQASKVALVGNYVVFVQLGGDIQEFLDQSDEAVITYCQEVNDSVIQAIADAVQ